MARYPTSTLWQAFTLFLILLQVGHALASSDPQPHHQPQPTPTSPIIINRNVLDAQTQTASTVSIITQLSVSVGSAIGSLLTEARQLASNGIAAASILASDAFAGSNHTGVLGQAFGQGTATPQQSLSKNASNAPQGHIIFKAVTVVISVLNLCGISILL